MPIPKPRKYERRDPFIERCMGNATMNEDYPDNAQRYAICIGAFDKSVELTIVLDDADKEETVKLSEVVSTINTED